MNRQDMAQLISQATDLPPQVRVMLNLFLARMTDKQVDELGKRAMSLIERFQLNDRTSFEKDLSDFMAGLGLPEQVAQQAVAFLSAKAFAPEGHPVDNADPNQKLR